MTTTTLKMNERGVYLLDNGIPLTIGPAFGAGRQGTIREVVGEPALAAKLFVKDHRGTDRVRRHLGIDARLWFAEGVPRLAWPIARLNGEGGDEAGYLMVRFDRGWQKLDDILKDSDRVACDFHCTWRGLVEIGISLARLVDMVNDNDLIVGDLSATNVLVSRGRRTALVDCDDMVSIDDPQDLESRPLTTEPYGAWELHESPPAKFSTNTDAWALGVMIIQLLQDGAHPFDGVGKPHSKPRGVLQNVEDGNTRFALPDSPHLMQPPSDPSWLPIDTLPPKVLELARRCVVDGRASPETRPTPAEWELELQRIVYVGCAEHAGHVFSDHLSSCPWCEHMRRGQADPFKSARGAVR